MLVVVAVLILRYISRLKKCKQAKTQMRLDTFFKTTKPAIKKEDKFDPFKKETKKSNSRCVTVISSRA